MNRGIIIDINYNDINNPRVIFQTFESSYPINVSMDSIDPELLRIYIQRQHDRCIQNIKINKEQAHVWHILHTSLNSNTPLQSHDDELWDTPPNVTTIGALTLQQCGNESDHKSHNTNNTQTTQDSQNSPAGTVHNSTFIRDDHL